MNAEADLLTLQTTILTTNQKMAAGKGLGTKMIPLLPTIVRVSLTKTRMRSLTFRRRLPLFHHRRRPLL